MRSQRRVHAEGRGLPAYMILHDSALREMARACPQNEAELAAISRVGAKRAGDFGERFLAEIRNHAQSKPLPSG